MSDQQSKRESITIPVSYREPDFLPDLLVDGGFGGISPKGMVSVALYTEARPLPSQQEITVEDGLVMDTRTVSIAEGLERRVCARLTMTPDAAKSIGEWLVRNAEAALSGASDGKE